MNDLQKSVSAHSILLRVIIATLSSDQREVITALLEKFKSADIGPFSDDYADVLNVAISLAENAKSEE